jgi:aspartate carbamoyltransferase catalytic subunit
VEVFSSLAEAVKGVDAVMCLRLQLERQQAGLLPDLREYAATYCLGEKHLALAREGVRVLHPGPLNRGVEIASSLADSAGSLVLDQVASGVAMRMALLFLYMTRKEGR